MVKTVFERDTRLQKLQALQTHRFAQWLPLSGAGHSEFVEVKQMCLNVLVDKSSGRGQRVQLVKYEMGKAERQFELTHEYWRLGRALTQQMKDDFDQAFGAIVSVGVFYEKTVEKPKVVECERFVELKAQLFQKAQILLGVQLTTEWTLAKKADEPVILQVVVKPRRG